MSFIFKSFSEEAQRESLIQTFVELSICCGVLYCIISLSAFLATSAIIGFLTVVGALMAIGQFPNALSLLIYYKKFVDGLVFVATMTVGVSLGLTAASSVVFAGIFFSLYLRWGENLYPKKESTESFLRRIQGSLKKFRPDKFWKW